MVKSRALCIGFSFVGLFLSSIAAFSQSGPVAKKTKKSHLDSIKVKAGHFFVIEKQAYYVPRDTVFVVPDTLHFYQKKHSLDGTNEFYDNLVKKLSDNKYSNLLYKLVFEKEEEQKAKQQQEEKASYEESKERYQAYEGAIIQDIRLKKLKVFGTNIEDTTALQTSLITKALNRIHFLTSDRIIKQNLLIEKGQTISPTELADNERLIRRLEYIKDARIYVNPSAGGDKASLHVVTRDVFPLKLDYNTDPETSAHRIGLSNINMFGSGHELENNLVVNDIGDSSIGYDGFYRVKNVAGTFLDSELNYVSTFHDSGYGVNLYRDFYTPEIRHAGGLMVSSMNHNQLRPFDNETDSIYTLSHKENLQDIWFARSFKTLHIPSIMRAKERLRFVVSARATHKRFVERPDVSIDRHEAFHHRTNILLSAGISSRGYYKDRLVRNFGRTEDIPTGTSIQLTSGYQFGEFFNRKYMGIELAEGGFFKGFGYMRGNFKLGGFFRKGHLEQGVLHGQIDYFSQLYTFNLFKLRQFISTHYTRGIRRKSQDFIDINDANGIRGMYNFFLIGTERFVLNTESVVFTPFYLGGFRMAVLGFFDLGFLNTSRGRDSYYGAGLGLRLKNDNLAINTLQLRLGFYPSAPFQQAGRQFNLSTIGNLSIEDFDISSPEIIPFK